MAEGQFTDDAPEKPVDYYCARITQADDEQNLAWSSPVWVKR